MSMKVFSTALVIPLIVICFLTCCTAQKNNTAINNNFESIIKTKLGPAFTIDFNESKSYALGTQQRQGDHIRRNFKYIVVRLSDNKILQEGSYTMGSVKWIDNNSIEIVSEASTHGRDIDSNKKVINVTTGEQ
jgi:hypothetical protein